MSFKRSRIIQISILAFSIAIFAFTIFSYRRTLSKIIKLTSEHSLKETSGLYTSYLQLRIQNDFNFLTAVATGFSLIDTSDHELTSLYIQQYSSKNDFSELYFIDPEGHTFTNDGRHFDEDNNFEGFIDIKQTDYFQRAFEKQSKALSKNVIMDINQNPSFALAVPVIQDGKSIGVVCGLMNLTKLNTNLSVTSIKTEGYFMIIDSDGRIIFASENKNRLSDEPNFIDFLKDQAKVPQKELVTFISRVRNFEKGVIKYKLENRKRFCSYSYLGLNRWYLLTIQPTDFLDEQDSNTRKLTILLSGVMIFLIIVFIALIFNANKQTRLVTDSKESLSKVYEKNKSLVLDIDLSSKTITYSGDTLFIFGKEIEKSDFKEFENFSKKIHKDDIHVIKQLRKAAFTNFTEYTAEFRILCDDEKYNWFRINNLPIFDENHKPIRCALSVTNVNKQVLKEQELILRAELDSLSGLLNKGSFESKVTEQISKYKNQICAFLIIDLDNFKMINDTLGHSMGDAAISDVAKKISLIFSIKDILGRIGGDEFCAFIVFEKTMPLSECIMHLNEKTADLCEILNEMYFNEDKYVEISASIGISIYPEQGESYSELFDKADNALYNVKKKGKNNFLIWNSDLEAGSESSYSKHKGLEELI